VNLLFDKGNHVICRDAQPGTDKLPLSQFADGGVTSGLAAIRGQLPEARSVAMAFPHTGSTQRGQLSMNSALKLRHFRHGVMGSTICHKFLHYYSHKFLHYYSHKFLHYYSKIETGVSYEGPPDFQIGLKALKPLLLALSIVVMACVYYFMWSGRPDYFRVQSGVNFLPLNLVQIAREYSAYSDSQPLPIMLLLQHGEEKAVERIEEIYQKFQQASLSLAPKNVRLDIALFSSALLW
jgi:hypothetical protein